MPPPAQTERSKNHRFPGEIISHGVWLYSRFALSSRDVQELLFERGIDMTYEAIRQWCRTFGQDYANRLRRRRAQPGDKWHMDAVFLTINGTRHYLWRAVDQDDHVLASLVQSRRHQKAAKNFFRKLLKGLTYVPRVVITEKLQSYGAAKREILPGGGTSAESLPQQPVRELASANAPAGAAYARVEVSGACPAIFVCLRTYGPTLPTATASAVSSQLSARDGESMRDLGRNSRHAAGRLKGREDWGGAPARLMSVSASTT